MNILKQCIFAQKDALPWGKLLLFAILKFDQYKLPESYLQKWSWQLPSYPFVTLVYKGPQSIVIVLMKQK